MKFSIKTVCCNKLILGTKKQDELSIQQTMYLYIAFLRSCMILLFLAPAFFYTNGVLLVMIAITDILVWGLARFSKIFYPLIYAIVMILDSVLYFLSPQSAYAVLPYFFFTNVIFSLIILRGISQIVIPLFETLFSFILLSFYSNRLTSHSNSSSLPYVYFVASITTVIIFFIHTVYTDRLRGDLVKRIDELKYLTYYDDLTSIYNKGYMYMTLKELFNDSRDRHMNDVSVIIFDLDNFKSINEKYGHQKGDHIIRSITSVVQRSIRRTDIFGRLSGEQFMVIIPSAGLTQARILGEKLRSKIDELEYTDNKIGSHFNVTASFGITIMREHDEAERDIIYRSEKLLFLSKKQGKNKVNFG